MSQIDFTTALARLLSDRALRAQFAKDPDQALDAIDVVDGDRSALLAVDVTGLCAQAESLLDKRCHEASAWIPSTWGMLGDSAAALFREYANRAWPACHPRPIIDATAFCRWLQHQRHATVCEAEVNRLEFRAGARRWMMGVVRNICIGGRTRSALQILYRGRRRTPGEVVLYMAL